MAKRTPAEWTELAADTILALLAEQHAVTSREIEARISEQPHPGAGGDRIDAIHVTNALRNLASERAIVKTIAPSRGGAPSGIWHLPAVTSRIDKAAQRKRLLDVRYRGWAQGTSTKSSLIGPAGEAAVDQALNASAPTVGYQLLPKSRGHLTTVHGIAVPGGPLDNAANLTNYDKGAPAAHATLLIEVKNVREHVYPPSAELHQLLHKSAQLQALMPTANLLPVLVCRWAHYTTGVMAAQCGFLLADQRRGTRQWVTNAPSRATQQKLDEVRTELGFLDLSYHDPSVPDSGLVAWLNKVPSSVIDTYPSKWRTVAPHVLPVSRALRTGHVGQAHRDSLRTAVAAATGAKASW